MFIARPQDKAHCTERKVKADVGAFHFSLSHRFVVNYDFFDVTNMKIKRQNIKQALRLEDVEAFYKLVSDSIISTEEVNREVQYLESLLCDLLLNYEKNPPDGFSKF
jgi:hypothetical protein